MKSYEIACFILLLFHNMKSTKGTFEPRLAPDAFRAPFQRKDQRQDPQAEQLHCSTDGAGNRNW
jgi:hypothetical protein